MHAVTSSINMNESAVKMHMEFAILYYKYIAKTLFRYKPYNILLMNQRANICRNWCVYMKRPCVFNDALTFIDDTSLYILVPGNLEGDRPEEVVLCSR
jgi:hypothetical protein